MSIVVKTWTGASGEYFTHEDMTRVESNADELAETVGRPTVQFLPVTRASQFRYDEAQRLEDLLHDIGLDLGVEIPYEAFWEAGRSVSKADFNRWENATRTISEEIPKTGRQLTWGTVKGRKWQLMKNLTVW